MQSPKEFLKSSESSDFENIAFSQKEWKAIYKWMSEYSAKIKGVNHLPLCTRVEVVDESGRVYTNYKCKDVKTSLQDEDRTLKVFISSDR